MKADVGWQQRKSVQRLEDQAEQLYLSFQDGLSSVPWDDFCDKVREMMPYN
jgi:hypothetical protein